MARGDEPAADATAERGLTLAPPSLRSLEGAAGVALDWERAAARIWGYESLKPGQREVLAAIAAGRDVLAIMPTGGGKSMCYQLPAMMAEGLTLVVSPLLALMRDQVAALQARGLPAAALNSEIDAEEDLRIRAAARAGAIKLLYCAPERLARADMAPLIEDCRLSMIAVDEAHCVAEWGHDFRPDYQAIGGFRARVAKLTGRRPQLAAFTATADADTRAEIVARLFDAPTSAPLVFVQGFDRPNLRLGFEHKSNAKARALAFVRQRPGQAGLIYAATRKGVEAIAAHLTQHGAPCRAYHAGLSVEERRAAEAAFRAEPGAVMAATVAFGMGVDRPDIRFVLHVDLPRSIEAYYQEVGRAGRDGAPAEALALYGLEDMRRRRFALELNAAPAARVAAERARLDALFRLAEAPRCRRQTLLGYFGETRDAPCGCCDLCQRQPEGYDGVEHAQKAMSAVVRTGQRFGVQHLISVLLGEPTDLALACGHQTLPTFGVGAELDRAAWRSVFRQLFAQGLVDMDGREGCVFTVTPLGREVLRGQRSVLLRRDSPPMSRAAADNMRRSALVDALRRARQSWATEIGVPPARVLSDRAIHRLCAAPPETLERLAAAPGVSRPIAKRFGPALMAILKRSA